MPRETRQVDLRRWLAPVPRVPDDEPLTVAGDRGDEVARPGDGAGAAVGADVLRDERVVGAHALDGAVVTGDQQPRAAEPREPAGGAGLAGDVLLAADFKRR